MSLRKKGFHGIPAIKDLGNFGLNLDVIQRVKSLNKSTKLKKIIMEDLVVEIQKKYNSLKSKEKIGAVVILLIFMGMFFFVSGISIGEAFYSLTHD